jgi:hypothetical protein
MGVYGLYVRRRTMAGNYVKEKSKCRIILLRSFCLLTRSSQHKQWLLDNRKDQWATSKGGDDLQTNPPKHLKYLCSKCACRIGGRRKDHFVSLESDKDPLLERAPDEGVIACVARPKRSRRRIPK